MERTTAQKKNYNLFRLAGVSLTSTDALTEKEKILYGKMMNLKNELTSLIKRNNNLLAKHPIKFTCWCGKRTSVKRVCNYYGENKVVCKHHLNNE